MKNTCPETCGVAMLRPPAWLAALFLTFVAFPCPADINTYMPELPPGGRMVDIGGRHLHIQCEGEGAPTVVLDSGIGGFSLEWTSVQRLLENKVKICAYDRGGYAWSEPGPPPRTTSQLVRELHTLLHNAGLAPPYVLVGHSFGGYNVMYFAKRYPAETAGLVLVDSSHPEQTERLPDIPARRDKSGNTNLVSFFQGQSTFELYPEDVRPLLMRAMSSYYMSRTQRWESLNFALSARQVGHAGALPDVPLLVITRGKRAWPDNPLGESLEREWQKMQGEMAGLAPHGHQVIAKNSGHLIHLEQPELVADAILSVVNDARDNTRVDDCSTGTLSAVHGPELISIYPE